ncbi:hypothetical protein [Actinocrispum sp. NPDC049592]|uniref:preATP grasp domain-containing protein n=1 Tax=Actinocrispum sp. NPDC049592 TaxID=3154835 RepID=UPI003444B369
MTGYLRAIKSALTGSPDTPLVLLCNFEAEAQWARRHVGLPGVGFSASTDMVHRMEELGVLLAGPGDTLVLSHDLDPGFRSYIAELGFEPPEIVVPSDVRPGRSTTDNAIASPGTVDRLTRTGGTLLPMGTSEAEQKLAAETGLPLAVPSAEVFERVNSKIYSRRLVEAAGLRPVPGYCCETADEFLAVLDTYSDGTTLVVKDAYGVSGKGLLVLDSRAKVDGLAKLVRRRATRTGDGRLHVVVEHWLPKRFDLNYQLTVARDGTITYDFVKQALTEGGVHKGHLSPVDLPARQHEELRQAVDAVGTRLFADGFHGVAGVDAILGEDGVLYPVLEINARLNMSTYQGGVTERLVPPGHVCLARHYPLRLAAPITFADVRRVLGPLLADRSVIVTCFGTVNANASGEPPFDGRLYTMLVAPDRTRLAGLDSAATAALKTLED